MSRFTPPSRRLLLALPLVLAVLLGSAAPAAAVVPYRAALVMEPSTGEILHEYNAHQSLPVASMVKMVTLLVVHDAVDTGEISWDQLVEVSREASRIGGSRVYLEQGEVFTVESLVAATMIKSANDAAYQLAITVGGTVDGFVERMNAKARTLGLEDSRFYTPNGLPPDWSGAMVDKMTARDLAIVGREVLKRPKLRQFAGTDLAWFRNGEFQLYNSNHLLRDYPHATGIKTGYHRFARFCVTASAKRGNLELIAVVMGADRKHDSFGTAERLLEEYLGRYRLMPLVRQGEPFDQAALVRKGNRSTVPVVAGDTARLLIEGEARPEEVDVLLVSDRRRAPIAAGDRVGEILVLRDGDIIASVPALAAVDVGPQPPWWRRLFDRFLG